MIIYEIVSKDILLKAPIKVIYGKNNYSIYSSNQTLEEVIEEDMEALEIIEIEDKDFVYKKKFECWYKKIIYK